MTQVSVTEVRNALRCPRLFAIGRQGVAVRFPVGASTLGATFHRLAERFAGAVQAPPAGFARLARGASVREVEGALGRWLLDLLVDELDTNPAFASMPSEVDDLAEALRQLAAHLAVRLGAFEGAPREGLPRLVAAAEVPLEAPLTDLGVTVAGRLDALYKTPSGDAVIVEYKLTDERGVELDRAQVALYQMLYRAQTGAGSQGVVLRFSPACAETRVSAAEAAALERDVLRPLITDMTHWVERPEQAPATSRGDLCGNCPVAAACRERYRDALAPRDVPPAGAARPRVDEQGRVSTAGPPLPEATLAHDTEGHAEAEQLAARIVEEFAKMGVSIQVHDTQVGARRVYLGLRVLRGGVRRLDAAVKDVLMALALPSVEYERRPHARALVVPRSRPRPVLLGPLLAVEQGWLSERPGRFVVGEQMDGQPLRVDLSDPATPHLLIGGQAGSGKSVLLLTIVAGLVQFHGPEAVLITLVDPKRVTFSPAFRASIAAHLDGPVLYDADAALPVLEALVDEMGRRYELLEAKGVQDLHEYNQCVEPHERVPRRVLLIDEFADLAAGGASKEFFRHVDRLGAKARAAGIHLVLATQRPDRETVPPRLKANLGGKIALRVANAVNSRIILDGAGAEQLLGRGDLLAELGRGVVRAQAATASAPSVT